VNHENNHIAAVCGNEVRIYGPAISDGDRRTLIRVETFPHHGAALAYAIEFDDRQRGVAAPSEAPKS
jgi:hypothetical protein